MNYKTISEQYETFISILEKNKDLMAVLDYITELKLPNFYIAAGSVFQTIWNYYDGNDLNFGIKDIDVIYYNNSDLSVEKDLEYYNIINTYIKAKGFNYEVDVSNEARMHLWKIEHNQGDNVEQYKNSEDAMSKWIATVHAIGITKVNDNIEIYAPYGLSDIYSRTIRPIKHNGNSKELYDKKVASWQNRFDNLNIIEW
ncbi:MAG: nucleotidyltransferase family protein [Bacilli bacterium]|jgi:hypothetical protein|nr:nucleotidyltransferase family protein [Bacilli bacterium]